PGPLGDRPRLLVHGLEGLGVGAALGTGDLELVRLGLVAGLHRRRVRLGGHASSLRLHRQEYHMPAPSTPGHAAGFCAVLVGAWWETCRHGRRRTAPRSEGR